MDTWQIWLEDLLLQGTVKLTVFGTHEANGYGIEAEIAFQPYVYKESGWSREGWGNSFDEVMDALYTGVE